MPLLLLDSYHAYECRSHVLAVFLAIVWTTFVFRPGSDQDPTRRAHNVLPRLASRLGTGTRPPILHLSRLPSLKSTYFTKWQLDNMLISQSPAIHTYILVMGRWRYRFFGIPVGIFSSWFGVCCRYFEISVRYFLYFTLRQSATCRSLNFYFRASSRILTEDPWPPLAEAMLSAQAPTYQWT